MAWQNIARLKEIERELTESRRCHVAAEGERHHVVSQEARGNKPRAMW